MIYTHRRGPSWVAAHGCAPPRCAVARSRHVVRGGIAVHVVDANLLRSTIAEMHADGLPAADIATQPPPGSPSGGAAPASPSLDDPYRGLGLDDYDGLTAPQPATVQAEIRLLRALARQATRDLVRAAGLPREQFRLRAQLVALVT